MLTVWKVDVDYLEHDECGQLAGEGAGVNVELLRHVGEPPHVHLAKLQIWQSVVVRQFGEDICEVDTGRGPGSKESYLN